MALRAAKRVKRASPYDLYKTCSTGVCPPDVVPKIEGDTIADRILKWGSLGVFLGGLGIGTGTGRGGTGGYRPLGGVGSSVQGARLPTGGPRLPGGEGRVVGSGLPSRPFGGPIDTIGAGLRPSVSVSASESVTITDSVLPDAPSVITPDIFPVDHGVGGLDISTDSNVDPAILFVEPHGAEDVAVLDLRPTEHSVTTYQSSSTTVHHNPSFHSTAESASDIAETSVVQNVYLGGSGVGSSGSESIELQVFGSPRTSTPAGRSVFRGASNWFSRRYYTQVRVQDPDFLENAPQYFGYTFENPVFEHDSFDLPAASPSARIPSDIRDVTHVSAARIFRGPTGRLGVGRVGVRSTIQTRTGVTIGGKSHFRYSLSTITEPSDSIELELQAPLANVESTAATAESSADIASELHIADTPDAMEEVDLHSTESVYSDTDLLDNFNESPHGVLSFTMAGDTDTVPVYDESFSMRPYGTATSDDLSPAQAPSNETPVLIDDQVVNPAIIITAAGVDGSYFINTFLHPSLLRRKRKRGLF